MTLKNVDPRDPPPSVEEQYLLASGTPNLGLPHGPGVGAQGILAAAAWTESHMGTVLMRLRTQWDRAKPHKRMPRSVEVLRSAGLPKDQAKRMHNRERVTFALAFYQAKKELRAKIPEYQQVVDELAAVAIRGGRESAEALAIAVLDRWLDDPKRGPDDVAGAWLWTYIGDCISVARAGISSGMRGLTRNHPE